VCAARLRSFARWSLVCKTSVEEIMSTNTLLTTLAIGALVGCARDTQPATPRTVTATTTTTTMPHHGAGAAPTDITAFLDPGAADRQPVRQAIAVLYSMKTGQRLGTTRFVDSGAGGLDVFASVDGLPGGTHAYHVHVYGDCSSPDAKSAGPHFHFTGSSMDTHVKMITGNLGELKPDAEGRATHQGHLHEAQLQGPFSLIGRSVVIHAHGNNPAVTPDGGAGDRIACGVIGVANPTPPSQPRASR
jgi:Cu-Zn family superoxide dismutase